MLVSVKEKIFQPLLKGFQFALLQWFSITTSFKVYIFRLNIPFFKVNSQLLSYETISPINHDLTTFFFFLAAWGLASLGCLDCTLLLHRHESVVVSMTPQSCRAVRKGERNRKQCQGKKSCKRVMNAYNYSFTSVAISACLFSC